ncbi:4'-phosphopantetheinyl transferase superfamily protein [Streptomyces sp. KL116D]|uniref:4'-phosphopantetheinyl transferase superfamily protein n=1 Tax=Streptomyces sp. KL116D TaxID=3045152 RepID=UPI0035562102
MAERLFLKGRAASCRAASGGGRSRLAARFAAKEAIAKASAGAPGGLRWTDAEVWVEESGQPRMRVTGTVAKARAAELGVTSFMCR